MSPKKTLATELSRDTYVNLMDQYYPAYKAKTEERFLEINRRITDSEFDRAIEFAHEVGLWRLDCRWRDVLPRYRFVEIPSLV